MSRPEVGVMCYWRFKRNSPGPWRFGYPTNTDNHSIIRMGTYNGDIMGGSFVDPSEIETKPYR